MKTKLIWLTVFSVTVCSTSLLGQDFIWTQTSAPTNLYWESIASSSDGTTLVAAVGGGAIGYIYTSTNSGATWTQSDVSGNWASVASSSDGSKLFAAYGGDTLTGGIYSSTNSGVTWTQTGAPNNFWQSIATSSDGTKLAAASEVSQLNGKIYTSTNSGATWTQTSAPTNHWWVSIASSSDGSKLFAAYGGQFTGGIYTSTNAGLTWTQTSAPNTNWISVASSADGTKLAAAVGNGGINPPAGIYTSTNSGATWTQTSAPTNSGWLSIASSSDGNKLAAVKFNGGIYASINSGLTWTQTSAPFVPPQFFWSIASSSDGNKVAAVQRVGGIYVGKPYPPSITQQPLNLASCPGSSPVIAVTVTGNLPFTYQWQKNGTNLMDAGNVTGSTSTNLTLQNVSQSDSANYDVIITNVAGSVTSSVATLIVTSVPAKATPVIYNGFIVGAILTDGGCGYTNQVAVFFTGQGGSGAAGYVQISNGSVTNIVITDAGFGYPANTIVQDPPFIPTVSIALTNTPAAAATPIIINGFIVGAILTASGSSYTVAPAVTFSDVSGHGAAAYAQISNGAVTNIFITDAGFGYSPNAVINIPPAAHRNAVVPSASSLMLGQNYQLQTASGLNNWTSFGSAFFATNNAWTTTNYWNVTTGAQIFFRLQMLP